MKAAILRRSHNWARVAGRTPSLISSWATKSTSRRADRGNGQGRQQKDDITPLAILTGNIDQYVGPIHRIPAAFLRFRTPDVGVVRRAGLPVLGRYSAAGLLIGTCDANNVNLCSPAGR